MAQLIIRDFKEGDVVEGFYAVQDATLLTTAAGKSYIRITLSDKSGVINGNIWDASKEEFALLGAGKIIKVRAVIESYRGKLQIKIERFRPAETSEVDYSQFIPTTQYDIDSLWNEFNGFIESVGDPEYKSLLAGIFSDMKVCDKFRMSPAAKSNHHAYLGGLLEHTVSLLRYAAAFAASSSASLDPDLLITGTILHDIGKIYELSAGVIIEYTDRGKLLGHLMIGTMIVEDAASGIKDFPEEKKLLVQHMILSHHGKHEYGSPVLPAIPEAFALHYIDNLDAKTAAACRILEEDESEASWTERSWMLDTTLYKKGYGEFDPVTAGKGSECREDAGSTKPAPKSQKKEVKSDSVGGGGLFE